MEIRHGVEKEDGTYVFQGVLTGNELKIVVETGINVLLAEGIIPFIAGNDDGEMEDASKYMEMPAKTQ